jgi:hypothetical protein
VKGVEGVELREDRGKAATSVIAGKGFEESKGFKEFELLRNRKEQHLHPCCQNNRLITFDDLADRG